MAELRRARERHPALPRVVLVHQGDLAQGARLVESRWPGAAAISDPELALYRAFGLEQGALGQIMGLAAVRSSFRAMRKGHFPGVPVGDVRILPGIFLVRGREVLWSRRFEHSGQLPDEDELVEAARAVSA